jgi:RNA polymerase sigma-70 factor (ECF subfamily)
MIDQDGNFRSELAALLPKLRRFALALTGTRHDADDVTQAAVVRALARPELWTPGTRLDSWMYKIVQNLWIDQLRSARRRNESVPLEDAAHVVGEDARQTTENRLMLAKAREAFDALAPEIRAAGALVILNGLSYAQAAETLGVPIGTIMSRVSRARAGLAAALGEPTAKERSRP